MKALVLAAGLGSRLGLDIPKPMFVVSDRPILEHNILLLKKHGIKDICINVHYKKEIIKDYFRDGSNFGVNIQYSEEDVLLGTSGAVKKLEKHLQDDDFIVVYGDNYSEINLTEMISFHKKYNPVGTIAVFNPMVVPNSGIAGGTIKIDDSFRVLNFNEVKTVNATDYVNAGVYILNPSILSNIPRNIMSDFGKDIFAKLIEDGKILMCYVTNSFVFAIDTKESLKETQKNTN